MTDDLAMPHVLATIADVERFIFAGNAVFTIKSIASGEHYTFRMTRAEAKHPNEPAPALWFVSLLTGSRTFTYIGVFKQDNLTPTGRFYTTKASKVHNTSPCCIAFRWFMRHICERHHIPDKCEVRHEGHCGRCNRPLTHPLSIDRGIGPDCWEAMYGGSQPNLLEA